MIISSVRSFLLSYPFPEPVRLPFYGGERTILKRDAMLIRIESDGGLVGYAPGPGSQRAQDIIESLVRPFLEGPDAGGSGRAAHPVYGTAGSGCRRGQDVLRRGSGPFRPVREGQGVPLSEVLGGRVRGVIRLYGSAGMYMPPERYAAEAAAIADLGFRAYKMRPAGGPEADLETVRQMRRAVGPDFDLMVDAHTWWRMGDRSYSFETVEQLAREMAEYDVAWLEEPLPPDDHEAYLRLKEKRTTCLWPAASTNPARSVIRT
jgi:L-alanine-DL-glutamate epimerase-like enolase superfamily enzyme